MKNRYHINPDYFARLALASVMACHREGLTISQDALDEIKLANSLVNGGYPTCEELEPFIGRKWAITRSPRYENRISQKQYFMAEVKALSRRLGLSEKFILTRFERTHHPDFHKQMREQAEKDVQPPRPRDFSVTIYYRTPGGNCNSWVGIVSALNHDEALEKAEEIVRKTRRVDNIEGGDASVVREAA